jgi:hypothetical protein
MGSSNRKKARSPTGGADERGESDRQMTAVCWPRNESALDA